MTLYELNMLVRETIETTLPDAYWVEAELSELRESNGHCYMELVQKDAKGNTPIARASAKCWRSKWFLVRNHFERVTGSRLRPGMKVLLEVYAQFHENYGFSWIVTDIDPTYTLGDMARKRKEILAQLEKEGVLELNKELELPMFTQNIAVISSGTAAGYGDFCDQLAANGRGLCFNPVLFQATMQGEGIEKSIIAALDRINMHADLFDCVVIIRGGGAVSDLSGFDSLPLAENVANFPLPIITGIGHERDESVLDIVAHKSLKTPTAVAAFLIDNLESVARRIDDSCDRITAEARRIIDGEKARINRLSERIPLLFSLEKTRHLSRLDAISERMKAAATRMTDMSLNRINNLSSSIRPALKTMLMAERHRIELLSQRAWVLDPERMLAKGYSITLREGRVLRDISQLEEGDIIETRLSKGAFTSSVKEKKTDNDMINEAKTK